MDAAYAEAGLGAPFDRYTTESRARRMTRPLRQSIDLQLVRPLAPGVPWIPPVRYGRNGRPESPNPPPGSIISVLV